ncbi:uncharacterized protein LOC115956713 [Quercus lobata]|uniref:uncharacterized protein LOC115956713 n=1 Tax=Quercus lobata TaxID=97700 RepID=UPI001247E9AE|nr:uncharacterized protein LOC115956713 [Quercus lobata]
MEIDCVDFVKSFHDCQTHANLNHVPPNELYSMTSSWPFSVWGIDVIGRIAPKTSNGHKHILVATDYFTKRVEATTYSVLKSTHVAQFIENNIICRYGVPQEIISDNGSHFKGEVITNMELYNIENHKSSLYQSQTHGAEKEANKNIKNILAKMVVTYKDWAEKLPFALWGYRISICASIVVTPYSLVYGSEVVLPIEVEIQSLRVLAETMVLEEDWVKQRYEQLTLIDVKRVRTQYHAQRYQKRIAKAFNKKVRPRNLKEGDLILKVLKDEAFNRRGYMKPRWIIRSASSLASGSESTRLNFEGNVVRTSV